MSFYRGMTCENVTINRDKGTPITAYVAKPSGTGRFPGVVLVHHLPGWSERACGRHGKARGRMVPALAGGGCL